MPLLVRVDVQTYETVTDLAAHCHMSVNLFLEEMLKHEFSVLGPDGRPQWLAASPPIQEVLDVTD